MYLVLSQVYSASNVTEFSYNSGDFSLTATLKSSLLMLMHVSASKYSAADADASRLGCEKPRPVSVSACATDVAGRNVADHAAAVGLDTQIGEDRLRVNDRVVQRLRDASTPACGFGRFLPAWRRWTTTATNHMLSRQSAHPCGRLSDVFALPG